MVAEPPAQGPESPPAKGGLTGVVAKGGPQRRCLVTAQVLPRDDMLRFVIGPDQQVVPDVDGTLPGRGYWLVCDRGVLDKAVRKRLFSRAARQPVQCPSDLADRAAGLLRARCLGLIGMARRAGQLVAGFDKAREALHRQRVGTAGKPAVMVAASDGADGGRSALAGLAPHLPVVDRFSAAELGRVLGRARTVHMVIADGRLAQRLLTKTACFDKLRGLDGGTFGADPAD